MGLRIRNIRVVICHLPFVIGPSPSPFVVRHSSFVSSPFTSTLRFRISDGVAYSEHQSSLLPFAVRHWSSAIAIRPSPFVFRQLSFTTTLRFRIGDGVAYSEHQSSLLSFAVRHWSSAIFNLPIAICRSPAFVVCNSSFVFRQLSCSPLVFRLWCGGAY